MCAGVILFELWSSLREIMHRKLNQSPAGASAVAGFQNMDEQVIKETAHNAYSILKYSLPSSDEDSMMNLLLEEYQF